MSIASSLKKAGYLSIGAEGLGKFLKKMRENQQEEEIAKASTDTYKKLKELFAPEPEFEEPTQTSITAISKEGIKQEIPFEERSIQIMPDYIPPEERKTKSKSLLADYLDKISSIKGIDPERVKKEFSFMELRSKLFEPKTNSYEVKQLDPSKDTVKIDEFGNIIPVSKGIKNKKEPEKVAEYIGKDGYKYIMFIDNDGNIKEVRSQHITKDKDSGINFPKSNKWRDIGNVLNMIDYTTDENGMVIPRTKEEKAKYRQIGLNYAKSILLPEALNWHNNEIAGKWNREDLAFEDYNLEIIKSLERGELTVEAAQDLIDFNVYRAKILNVYNKEPFYKDKILGNNNQTTEGKK